MLKKKPADPFSDSKPDLSETTITNTDIISVIVNVGKIQSLVSGTQSIIPKLSFPTGLLVDTNDVFAITCTHTSSFVHFYENVI